MNKIDHVVWDVFMVTRSSIVAIIFRECCNITVGCSFNRVTFIMDS
jgi:hypothetical protein